jgi:hypothetical protein
VGSGGEDERRDELPAGRDRTIRQKCVMQRDGGEQQPPCCEQSVFSTGPARAALDQRVS